MSLGTMLGRAVTLRSLGTRSREAILIVNVAVSTADEVTTLWALFLVVNSPADVSGRNDLTSTSSLFANTSAAWNNRAIRGTKAPLSAVIAVVDTSNTDDGFTRIKSGWAGKRQRDKGENGNGGELHLGDGRALWKVQRRMQEMFEALLLLRNIDGIWW